MSVLKVLDEILARFEHGETLSPMPSGKRVTEARAAVAELIEAARSVAEIVPATCANDEKWLNRLDAALARIGGAP
jgi:hypothetical protein